MKQVYLLLLLSVMGFSGLCYASTSKDLEMTAKTNNPIVLLKTTQGDIKIELYPEKAPVTVKNFLQYVNEGFYANTIFHRVIEGFMIQGGGFTKDMQQKTTHAAIKNEADNGLSNKRGTIAMARTGEVNSATAQFFINTVDNPFLDFKGKTPREYGYCVFGKVIEGMDTVDKIKKVKTSSKGPFENVPVETVEILEAKQIS